jgi:hypothetical protein
MMGATAERADALMSHALPRPVAIWPAASSLPANVLRFYVEFSSPAEADFERENLSVRTASGEQVQDAFLILNEELWSADGRRLTIFMEPGRIKRGMGATTEHEPALVAGGSYRLEVSTAGGVLVKEFEVLPAVTKPIAEGEWALSVPAAGSRQPLSIAFGRVMDNAILDDEFDIRDPDGERVKGVRQLLDGRTFRLMPDSSWKLGPHKLLASLFLEDVCGNRVGEALDHKAGERQASRVAELMFFTR